MEGKNLMDIRLNLPKSSKIWDLVAPKLSKIWASFLSHQGIYLVTLGSIKIDYLINSSLNPTNRFKKCSNIVGDHIEVCAYFSLNLKYVTSGGTLKYDIR